MKRLKEKISLITGATSGIGEACAVELARDGSNLILTGRRIEKLENLANDLIKKYDVDCLPLTLDVRDKNNIFKTIETLSARWRSIDILINNAGLARGMAKLSEVNSDDWDEMIDTNVKGLLNFTRAVVPGMIKRGKGHVVNIGSIAGHEVYPGGNVYCATKHAVDALTKGLRLDLVDTPLRVSSVDPGLVETEFSMVRFRGDKDKAANVYKGLEALRGKDIAEIVLFIVTRPAHVQIADTIVFPTAQASAMVTHRE